MNAGKYQVKKIMLSIIRMENEVSFGFKVQYINV